jgi:hypothetical protein
VVEQAYLYRIEASGTLDRLPIREESKSTTLAHSVPKNKLREFGRSMAEIEALRAVQAERLKNYVRSDKLPDGISDPAWLPWLNPIVREVVVAFPAQAEEIVKKHGLDSDEFNGMLAQSKASQLFRWNVQRQIR